ncbi:MAG TPA: hypothetical protein VMD25_02035 [Acidobacteriaceae bacterium]|nr:hypothetical protein [Acidobacteriaceae bacterium]
MDTPEKTPASLPLSVFQVPRYRYFPTPLFDRFGPKQWERLKILQTCERLKIPLELWPNFPFPQMPMIRPIQFSDSSEGNKLQLPVFRPLEESIAEWKRRCHSALDETLDKRARILEAQFQAAVQDGLYRKVPQQRGTTPADLRYEWVAKRICYRMPYKELASGGYSAERIKQSVLQILKIAAWKRGI